FISTVEKLFNPARSPLLTGVFHGPVLRQMDAVLRGASYPRSLVIQGSQGSTDPKVSVPTRALLVDPDREGESIILNPLDFGLAGTEEPLMDPPSSKAAADWTRQVLVGEDEEGRKAVILALAAILFLADETLGFSEAVSQARSGWEAARHKVFENIPVSA
ncbi:MAG: hypothetical protein KC931_20740, partial [Candidatus Omnitrophica bacterium]|nr:hypothetical protein [Candidatus Omnitrophota bacterium]